jgi:hypothetical protein
MSDAIVRPEVHQEIIDVVGKVVRQMLEYRLRKHGPGAYAGPHEILGILEEEFLELKEAIVANDGTQTCAELVDIAVGCIFGVASLVTLGRHGTWYDQLLRGLPVTPKAPEGGLDGSL